MALFVAGCPTPDPNAGLTPATTNQVEQTLDYNDFVCDAEPVLIKRCSMLACHGQATHALRLYSPGKLRQGDPTTRMARDTQLTANEVDLNFQSAIGLTLGATQVQRNALDVSSILLLQKPLAARFGGSEHHGVAIFPTYGSNDDLTKDPEWNALANWVAGKKQSAANLGTDCTNLFMAMGLTPR
jgi:hypothetical protein